MSKRRFRLFVFLVKIWRACECPRLILPVAVKRKRLAAPLCVFSFGMIAPFQNLKSEIFLLGPDYDDPKRRRATQAAALQNLLESAGRFLVRRCRGRRLLRLTTSVLILALRRRRRWRLSLRTARCTLALRSRRTIRFGASFMSPGAEYDEHLVPFHPGPSFNFTYV